MVTANHVFAAWRSERLVLFVKPVAASNFTQAQPSDAFCTTTASAVPFATANGTPVWAHTYTSKEAVLLTLTTVAWLFAGRNGAMLVGAVKEACARPPNMRDRTAAPTNTFASRIVHLNDRIFVNPDFKAPGYGLATRCKHRDKRPGRRCELRVIA